MAWAMVFLPVFLSFLALMPFMPQMTFRRKRPSLPSNVSLAFLRFLFSFSFFSVLLLGWSEVLHHIFVMPCVWFFSWFPTFVSQVSSFNSFSHHWRLLLCFQLLSFSSHRDNLWESLSWHLSWQRRWWWCEEHDCESGAKYSRKVSCHHHSSLLMSWTSSKSSLFSWWSSSPL